MLGAFDRATVIVVVVAMAAVATIRPWQLRTSFQANWSQRSVLIYVFGIGLMIPTALDQSLTSLLRSDEIYSWNMWAVNHVFGEAPDSYYKKAPYPQNLPLLIATGYNLLGSVDLQMPIKCSLALLWASMFAAVGMATPRVGVSGLIVFGSIAVMLLSKDLWAVA